jgi:hypothetical protein
MNLTVPINSPPVTNDLFPGQLMGSQFRFWKAAFLSLDMRIGIGTLFGELFSDRRGYKQIAHMRMLCKEQTMLVALFNDI